MSDYVQALCGSSVTAAALVLVKARAALVSGLIQRGCYRWSGRVVGVAEECGCCRAAGLTLLQREESVAASSLPERPSKRGQRSQSRSTPIAQPNR